MAQERLALHLLIAAAVFGALIYAAVGLSDAAARAPPRAASRLARRAFAGADRLCPARPRRAGRGPARRAHLQHLAADGRLASCRAKRSASPGAPMLNDPATAQFDHRLIAYARLRLRPRPGFRRRSAARAGRGAPDRALWPASRRCKPGSASRRSLFAVPIPLALAHQAIALILFGLAVWHWRATQMDGDDRVSRRAPQPCRPGC